MPKRRRKLKQLSPRSLVALAARSAMRVQPLVTPEVFSKDDEWARAQRMIAIDKAITSAAAGSVGVPILFDAAMKAARIANEANRDAGTCGELAPAFAAYAACAAANTAANVSAHLDRARSAIAAGVDGSIVYAENAFEAVSQPQWKDSCKQAVHIEADNDWDLLHAMRNDGDVTRPVPAEFFARPLWECCTPPGWHEYLANWTCQLERLGNTHPEVAEISSRYTQLLEGKCNDWETAGLRVNEWFKRQIA